VLTDPDAIKLALKPYLGRLRRVGHEAGSFSPRLRGELLKLGRPALERLPSGICAHWNAPPFDGAQPARTLERTASRQYGLLPTS
jgi:hypothetical protein